MKDASPRKNRTIAQIQNFEEKLLVAFAKMIKGIPVKLTEEGIIEIAKYLKDPKDIFDDNWEIDAVNKDETLDIINASGEVIMNFKYIYLDL